MLYIIGVFRMHMIFLQYHGMEMELISRTMRSVIVWQSYLLGWCLQLKSKAWIVFTWQFLWCKRNKP